ncbi:MAG: hypothetical protein FWE69_02280 [Clostridiales bacterium]|nr:hypothetical protein [Clostridiales bacterium]
MDVTFDSGKSGKRPPRTRIYAPTHKPAAKQVTYIRFEDDTDAAPLAVQPQPNVAELEELPAAAQPKAMTMQSKILLLLAIFLVSATILLGLRGNAEIARIYTDIARLDKEIGSIEEELSQIKKDQGAMSGYIAIRDSNEEAGRILNWNTD